jgi:hypothetical protein
MPTSPSYFGNFSNRDQPTLNTVADYIADARTLLQDVIPPYRYDDASLLVALNVTLLEARRLRSDLFVFNMRVLGQTQAFAEVDDTYVEMEPQFRLAILHGLCAHALERDQEDVQDMRATSYFALFSAGLVGRALPGVAGGSGPGRGQQGQ